MDRINQLIKMIETLDDNCSQSNPNMKKELLAKAAEVKTKVESMEDAFDSIETSIIKLSNESQKKR